MKKKAVEDVGRYVLLIDRVLEIKATFLTPATGSKQLITRILLYGYGHGSRYGSGSATLVGYLCHRLSMAKTNLTF